MPSTDHEMPLQMFQNRPELAPELLQSVLGIEVPAYDQICLGSEAFTDCDPTEYRSDATVLLGPPEAPALAIVLEVQLRPDKRKEYSWPVYVATLYARKKCPVALLVLCPDAATTRSCAKPLQVGHPDGALHPLVVDLSRFPAITDQTKARQLPELAVLSTLAHADGPDRDAVLRALCDALSTISEDEGPLYYDYVTSRLSEAARHSLEEIMKTGTYEYQSDFARKYYGDGKAEGKVEGKSEEAAKLLLTVLSTRGLRVSEETTARITSCTDLDQLEAWVSRAVTASTAEELFD